jgi:hypothetical protein
VALYKKRVYARAVTWRWDSCIGIGRAGGLYRRGRELGGFAIV